MPKGIYTRKPPTHKQLEGYKKISERHKGKLNGINNPHAISGLSSSHHIEYLIWYRLNDRCTNTWNYRYKDYGGRGIKVCDRWSRDLPKHQGLKNFLEDMGLKPEPKEKYSIHRIDNDGNYEPSNCKWATATEQASNRRKRNLINI